MVLKKWLVQVLHDEFFEVILPSSTGVPSLATDVVTTVAVPVHAELATSAVGVGDSVGSVGPEGEVEAIADTSRRVSTLLETGRRLSLDLGGVGDGEGASDGRGGGKKVGEGDHFDCDELEDCDSEVDEEGRSLKEENRRANLYL
jgi:hypothetical protein